MEQVFIGRQTILNKRESTFGYELLFRNASSLTANVTDNSMATASVMVNALNNIGFKNLVGEKKGFINVNYEMLSGGFTELLPKDNTVLEILEHVDINTDLIALCGNLKEIGYCFALDDFIYNDSYLPLLNIAQYIKLDILMYNKKDLEDIVKLLKKHPVKLLAEKVETKEDFKYCYDLGFEFFQGYFFSKPTIVTGKTISSSQLVLFELFNSLSKEEEINIIERQFKKNPQLDIKLLKFINSAGFYLTQKIDSIRQAIMMLGYHNLQKWVALMLFAKESEDLKSNPLLERATIRGLMMESMANSLTKSRTKGDSAFIAGILSLTDALLGIPLNDIISDLNLSKEIYNALVTREGFLGELLYITEKFEKEELNEIQDILSQHKIDIKDLLAAETKAIMEFEHIDNKE
ncbi:MAG: HDOD domain-containing protein [Proteobacteria bacterium]|nr:HDOD domain-containing protein [Pseudomonadota bacterium]